jgi:hypothetical protein
MTKNDRLGLEHFTNRANFRLRIGCLKYNVIHSFYVIVMCLASMFCNSLNIDDDDDDDKGDYSNDNDDFDYDDPYLR